MTVSHLEKKREKYLCSVERILTFVFTLFSFFISNMTCCYFNLWRRILGNLSSTIYYFKNCSIYFEQKRLSRGSRKQTPFFCCFIWLRLITWSCLFFCVYLLFSFKTGKQKYALKIFVILYFLWFNMPFKLQFIVKGDKALLSVVWKQFGSHITGDILVTTFNWRQSVRMSISRLKWPARYLSQ